MKNVNLSIFILKYKKKFLIKEKIHFMIIENISIVYLFIIIIIK